MKLVGSLMQRGQTVAASLCINLRSLNWKWSGEIQVPKGCALRPGSFQLVLSDGRRGNITINNVSGRSVFFEGDGALS